MAHEVKAFLRHPDSDALELIEGTGTLKELGPGSKATVELRARTLSTTEDPQEVELVVSEHSFRLFVEDSVKLEVAPTFSTWRAPPRLELERFIETDDGYALMAKATDETGIQTMLGHRDGNQSSYVDTGAARPKVVRISIPWRPDEDVKTITIVATDSDGLTTRLATEL
jgi:hypothetical protein